MSCTALIQPSPAMRIYSIFSNGESIHESMEGVNTVSVSDPIEGTQYTCMAGNYLGNTALSAAVPYDPRSKSFFFILCTFTCMSLMSEMSIFVHIFFLFIVVLVRCVWCDLGSGERGEEPSKSRLDHFDKKCDVLFNFKLKSKSTS